MKTTLAMSLSLPLAALVAGLLAGCADGGASGGPADPPSGGGTLSGLGGRTFLSIEVGEGHEERPLVHASRITLTFAADSVRASAGCNILSGPARYDDSTLHVDGPLAGTEMGCPDGLMRQDEWLADFITSEPRLELNGDRLTMTAGSTVVTLLDREVVEPDRPLVGTGWRLESITAGGDDDGAASSVPSGVRSTLQIDGERISLQPGCNTGGGRVHITDTTLTMKGVAMTLMGCLDERGDVERRVLAVLRGTVDYAIDGDVLTLIRGDKGLVYRASDRS